MTESKERRKQVRIQTKEKLDRYTEMSQNTLRIV